MDNVKLSKLAVLAVPYPQAIAGIPRSYSFDWASRNMTLSFLTNGNEAETEIFLPALHYPAGYDVSVSGARVVSDPHASMLKLVAAEDARQVAVTIRPSAIG
jgi:endoglycosylceramidase